MAKLYVKAKWYENSLKYQKEYRKDKTLIAFRVKENVFNRFKDICKEQNISRRMLIIKELKDLDK